MVIFMYRKKMRYLRCKKNITQAKLAFKVGISQNFLSEIEHSKYDIRVSLLIKIAKVLDVCIKDIIPCSCNKCKSNNSYNNY